MRLTGVATHVDPFVVTACLVYNVRVVLLERRGNIKRQFISDNTACGHVDRRSRRRLTTLQHDVRSLPRQCRSRLQV